MNDSELRANDIKEHFEIVHENHCNFFKIFKKTHLSKIKSLDDDEYLRMKTWITEYSRMLQVVQNHILAFEECGSEEEFPDEDKIMKQAIAISMFLKFSTLN